MIVIFFFQAEDGIRDWSVTGVQTCALPIFPARIERYSRLGLIIDRSIAGVVSGGSMLTEPSHARTWKPLLKCRSEERRVGKECRSRWWPLLDRREGGGPHAWTAVVAWVIV